METLVYLLAIFGLAFFLKESDGPFDIILHLRNKLMSNKYLGVFFYKLLSCYFCCGFHCGYLIYLLSQKNWSFNLLICWALAGGTISLILDAVIDYLHQDK
jgi:hypothetical protein